MRGDLEAVQIAVRVLTAITDKAQPEETDVEFLLRHAPDLSNEPLDDIACLVVQRALRQAKAQAAA